MSIIGVCGQKGGCGKSTISRLIATEYAAAGWTVKIADLDIGQGTSFSWQQRRLQSGLEPVVPVERFGTVDQALKVAPHYDLLVLDAPPHSTAGTLRIGEAADLLVLPTGLAIDDLEPTVLLAHELAKRGVTKIVFALCRVGESDQEIIEARDYITRAGYRVLPGELPEKVAYRRASDTGKTVAETRYNSLNQRSGVLAQGIVDAMRTIQTTNGHEREPGTRTDTGRDLAGCQAVVR